ncbi:hypothetical protein OF83DRAFT_285201 [Amylostereum chailletii]|nr:hypothetical protein OF83DRAFT_285201 [Amylostereum chailletii]
MQKCRRFRNEYSGKKGGRNGDGHCSLRGSERIRVRRRLSCFQPPQSPCTRFLTYPPLACTGGTPLVTNHILQPRWLKFRLVTLLLTRDGLLLLTIQHDTRALQNPFTPHEDPLLLREDSSWSAMVAGHSAPNCFPPGPPLLANPRYTTFSNVTDFPPRFLLDAALSDLKYGSIPVAHNCPFRGLDRRVHVSSSPTLASTPQHQQTRIQGSRIRICIHVRSRPCCLVVQGLNLGCKPRRSPI